MWLVQACRGCLTTEGKLERVNDIAWRMFEAITGFEYKPSDGYPTVLCAECRWIVKKSIAYRRKCRRAFLVLKQIMMAKGVVLIEDIKKVDRKKNNLESSFGLWHTSNTSCYNIEEVNIKQDDLDNKDIHMVSVYTVMNKIEPDTEQSILHIVDILPEETTSETTNYISEVLLVDNRDFYEKNADISQEDGKNFDIDDVFADFAEVPLIDEHVSEDDREQGFEEFNETSDTNNITKQEPVSEEEQEKASKTKKRRKKNKTGFFNLTRTELPKLAYALENSTIRALSVDEQRDVLTRRLTEPKFADATFRCVLCVCVFKSLVDLNAHARCHSEHLGGLKCDICSFSCKNEADLLYHRASGHLYEYTCVHCSMLLYCSNDLLKHMQKEHGQLKSQLTFEQITKKIPKTPEEMYRKEPRVMGKTYCPHCNTSITPSQLARHIRKKHEVPYFKEGLFKCDICETWFTRKEALYKHMNLLHNYKYQCQICQEISLSRTKALKHFDKHQPDRSECEICNKKILKRHLMIAHKRTAHQVLGTLHCAECAFNCDGTFSYYKHQLLQHGYFIPVSVASNIDAAYQCSQCDVKFRNEIALKTHLLMHAETADNVTNVCHKCQKVCDDADVLEKHLTTCKFLRKCPYCPAEARSGLYKHVLNSHPGLPFIYKTETTLCETCGATIPVSKLRDHLLKHDHSTQLGTKCPFCEYCNRLPVGLLTHVVKHHVDKPWQCKVCLLKFNRKNKCKIHIVKAHGGYNKHKVRCEICQKELSALNKLRDHYSTWHGIEYKETEPKVRGTPKGRVFGNVGNHSSLVQQAMTKLIIFPHMQLNLTNLGDVNYLVQNVEVKIMDYFWNCIGDAPDKYEFIKLSKPKATDGDVSDNAISDTDAEEMKRKQRIKINLYETTDIDYLPKDDLNRDTPGHLLQKVKKAKKRPARNIKTTVKAKVIKRGEGLQTEIKGIDNTKADFSNNIVVKKSNTRIPVNTESVVERGEGLQPKTKGIDNTKIDFSNNIVVKKRKTRISVSTESVVKKSEDLKPEITGIDNTKADFSNNIVVKKRKTRIPVTTESVVMKSEDLQPEIKDIDNTQVDFSNNIAVKNIKTEIPVAKELVVEEQPCEGIVLDESSVFFGDEGCPYAMIEGVLYKVESSNQDI